MNIVKWKSRPALNKNLSLLKLSTSFSELYSIILINYFWNSIKFTAVCYLLHWQFTGYYSFGTNLQNYASGTWPTNTQIPSMCLTYIHINIYLYRSVRLCAYICLCVCLCVCVIQFVRQAKRIMRNIKQSNVSFSDLLLASNNKTNQEQEKRKTKIFCFRLNFMHNPWRRTTSGELTCWLLPVFVQPANMLFYV